MLIPKPVLNVPIFLVLLAALAAPAYARKPETGFLDRTIIVSGQLHRYSVFLPSNWNPKQKWPVILFLHGWGERGDNGLSQTNVGLPEAIRRRERVMPFVVVIPQCLAGEHAWPKPDMEELALATLKASVKEFNGDPERTYLTGLSMGGYATWDIAATHPGIFAAYVPICGGIRRNAIYPLLQSSLMEDSTIADPYAETARRIGKTPVWIFHGDADTTTPVEESRKMADALRVAGGDVKYTEYPGVGHDSWTKAYDEPELVPWLLEQRLHPPKERK
jgi:predicted peptidase